MVGKLAALNLFLRFAAPGFAVSLCLNRMLRRLGLIVMSVQMMKKPKSAFEVKSGDETRVDKRKYVAWFVMYALPVIGFVFTRPTTYVMFSVL